MNLYIFQDIDASRVTVGSLIEWEGKPLQLVEKREHMSGLELVLVNPRHAKPRRQVVELGGRDHVRLLPDATGVTAIRHSLHEAIGYARKAYHQDQDDQAGDGAIAEAPWRLETFPPEPGADTTIQGIELRTRTGGRYAVIVLDGPPAPARPTGDGPSEDPGPSEPGA
jgi:hypothetical protein